jgi:hypothetical protein
MAFLPGFQHCRHGEVSTPEDLKRARDFVADSISVVEKDIAAGKTLDEVKTNAGFLEKYKQWNNGGRWLEAVYKSLNIKQTASNQAGL